MKKLFFIVVVLAILVSMLPLSSVFATKGTQYVNLTVINRTKSTVSIDLVSPDGLHYFYDMPFLGTTKYTYALPEGQYYQYFIITKCETKHGMWNMSRSRIINLYCPADLNSVAPFGMGNQAK